MWETLRAVNDDLERKDIQRGDSERGIYECREWPRVCGVLHAIVAKRGIETLLAIVAPTALDNLGRDLVRAAEYDVNVMMTELNPRWCEVAFVSLDANEEMSIDWVAWQDVARRHFERSIQPRHWQPETNNHVLLPLVIDEESHEGGSTDFNWRFDRLVLSATSVLHGRRPTLKETGRLVQKRDRFLPYRR